MNAKQISHQPTPWTIAKNDPTQIEDADGALVTFVTNNFKVHDRSEDVANTSFIVRAVNDYAAAERIRAASLALVRAHYDGDEAQFLEAARELAKALDADGKAQCASFVRAQCGDEPSWVPMGRPARERDECERLRGIVRNLVKPLDGVPLDGVSLVTMTIDKHYVEDARAALKED